MKQVKIIYYSYGNRTENKIALTFDDGPNPFFTEKVLEILQKHHLKATFFLIGKWAVLYPQLVKKIFSDGHLIGNHSYSHFRGDFQEADRIIKKIIGKSSNFIRPPYSNLDFCFRLKREYLKNKKIIIFNIDSLDWKNLSSLEIIRHIKNRITNGSIIDFHDGSEDRRQLKNRPSRMLEALPVLIDDLKENYNLVRVDELLLIPQIKVFL